MAKKRTSERIRRVQEAVPLETIYRSGAVKNKLGGLAAALEVVPVSLGLLDEEGRQALHKAYHTFLSRLPGRVYLHARDATPDLSSYLAALKERARAAPSAPLHAVALELYGWVQSLLAEKAVRETRYYAVVPFQPRPADLSLADLLLGRSGAAERRRHLDAQVAALLQRAKDVGDLLFRAGPQGRLLGPEEMLNLLRAVYDPTRPPVALEQATRLLTSGPDLPVAEEEMP